MIQFSSLTKNPGNIFNTDDSATIFTNPFTLDNFNILFSFKPVNNGVSLVWSTEK